MLIRGSYVHLTDGSLQSFAFMVEMILLIIPLAMVLAERVRKLAAIARSGYRAYYAGRGLESNERLLDRLSAAAN